MPYMFDTQATFQFEMSKLKLAALLNIMYIIFVTLPTFHLEMSELKLMLVSQENMNSISFDKIHTPGSNFSILIMSWMGGSYFTTFTDINVDSSL